MAIDRVRRAETAAVPVAHVHPAGRGGGAVGGARAAIGETPGTGRDRRRRRGGARPGGTPPPASRGRSRGPTGPRLRVLTANLYFGRGDAEVVVSRVRQGSVDVLFLQELTADAVTRLKQAGLDDLMPHAQLDLRGGSRGSGIYSRFPLTEGPPWPRRTWPSRPPGSSCPAATPWSWSACTRSPRSWAAAAACRGARSWRTLPPPGELPRVLAGDFNATLDHAAFRDVLGLGYADAGRQAGKALTPTWGPPGQGRAVHPRPRAGGPRLRGPRLRRLPRPGQRPPGGAGGDPVPRTVISRTDSCSAPSPP